MLIWKAFQNTEEWCFSFWKIFPVLEIQYRSKVSYHPSSRFSQDKTLVSREPLKRIFWNKLQAVSLGENYEFLATQWRLPCESIWFFGNCFTCCFKRNEQRLTSKKPKWKRWKMNIKDVHKNSHSEKWKQYSWNLAPSMCIKKETKWQS